MVELYIEDRKIDLTEDLEISFTYEQIDADKLSSIKNSFSKTVNIPGTPNNNITFGHIFRMDRYLSVNATTNIGEGYDPHKKTNWLITKNGAVVNRGYCTLDNIVVREERDITYQLTLYGGIGEFFYNLSYVTSEDTYSLGDIGKPKNLADLYWKWRPKTSLFGNGAEMSPDEENTQTIMKCSAEIVAQSYHALSPIYTYSGTTDIDKDVCFVPCYTGLYGNFDSKHILVSTFNQRYLSTPSYLSNSNKTKLLRSFPDTYVEDGETYSTLDNNFSSSGAYRYGLVTFSRDVDPWEAGDLRVNELPVAIRLSKLMNVISQPYNNGGYEVEWDENILNSYHWLYGWVMLGKLKQEREKVEILEITANETYDGQQTLIEVNNHSGYVTNQQPMPSYFLNTSSSAIETGNYNMLINVFPNLKFQTAYRNFVMSHSNNNIISGSYHVTQNGFRYVYTTSVLVHKIYDGNTLIKSIADIFYFSTNPDVYCFGYNNNGVHLSDIEQVLNGKINEHFSQQGQFIDEYRYHNCKIESPTETLDEYDMTTFDIQCASELIRTNLNITSVVSNLRIEQSQGVMWTNVSSTTAITAGMYGTDAISFDIDDYVGNIGFLSLESPYSFVTNSGITFFGYYNEDVHPMLDYNRGYVWFNLDENKQNGILVSKESGFNILNLDKKTLFANTQTPMKYLSSFCKLMNYRFICDNTTKKIQIKTLKNYYINETLDINERVDNGRDISIKNVTTKYKTINIGLETPETYPVSLFNRISEDKFNVRRYGTGFNYPLPETSLLNDLVYRNTIEWQQSSIYYNNNPQLPQPYNTQSVSWTLFNVNSTNTNNIKKKEIFTVGADSNTLSMTDNVDFLPKIALFDKSNKQIDVGSSLIFLNGFVKNYDYTDVSSDSGGSDLEEPIYVISPRVCLSNDTYIQYYLNQDRCYIYDFKYNDNFAYWGFYSWEQKGCASSWVLPMFSRDLYNYYDEYYKSWKNSEYKLASWNLVNQEGLDSQYNLINTKFIHQPYYNYAKTIVGGTGSINNEYEVHFIPEDNEDTERIFDRNWKDYMDDLYDRNTRDVTLYVDLSGFGDANTIMRKFYAWKSHLWIIKKIENYKINDVTRDRFTRVTFHKIKDMDTWTHTV